MLIFGRFGFSEMWVEGAAIATVIAGFTPPAIGAFLVFGRENNDRGPKRCPVTALTANCSREF